MRKYIYKKHFKREGYQIERWISDNGITSRFETVIFESDKDYNDYISEGLVVQEIPYTDADKVNDNAQISQQREEIYKNQTDKMFMEANFLEGAEKDVALQAWKDAVAQIKLDLPYIE